MTLQHSILASEEAVSRVESRHAERQQKLKYKKWDHMSTIYFKLDESMSRTAAYLQQEDTQTEQRRAKKRVPRAIKQTADFATTEHEQAIIQAKAHKNRRQQQQAMKTNTAHATPDVDPVSGLTWQQRRVERQRRRQQQQQQLSHEWAEKIEILSEAHVPERLILPLLRKYEGDVSAVLAYHVSYHQQRVASKHHAQQQRVKKSYADTTVVRSCAAEQHMLLATDPTLSQHLRDFTLV